MASADTAVDELVSRLLASFDSMFESAASLRRSSAILDAATIRLRQEADELARAPALFDAPKRRLLQERDHALRIAREADRTLAKFIRMRIAAASNPALA